SCLGQSLTFTATVSVTAPGTGVPTGAVQFRTNGVNLDGAITLSGNTATSLAITLPAGNNPVVAIYSGDANFNTNTSSTLSQTVNTPPGVTGNPTDLTACGGSSATFS